MSREAFWLMVCGLVGMAAGVVGLLLAGGVL
jgi:hypothetical protein